VYSSYIWGERLLAWIAQATFIGIFAKAVVKSVTGNLRIWIKEIFIGERQLSIRNIGFWTIVSILFFFLLGINLIYPIAMRMGYTLNKVILFDLFVIVPFFRVPFSIFVKRLMNEFFDQQESRTPISLRELFLPFLKNHQLKSYVHAYVTNLFLWGKLLLIGMVIHLSEMDLLILNAHLAIFVMQRYVFSKGSCWVKYISSIKNYFGVNALVEYILQSAQQMAVRTKDMLFYKVATTLIWILSGKKVWINNILAMLFINTLYFYLKPQEKINFREEILSHWFKQISVHDAIQAHREFIRLKGYEKKSFDILVYQFDVID
jgi:hypothetical protein